MDTTLAAAIGLIRSRDGRFSALRATTLLLAVLPALHLAAQYWLGNLGGRPITELIHGTGDWTVVFLLLSLGVTPARALLNWPEVIQLRRMLGVTAACYGAAHILMYTIDSKWRLGFVVSEIALRFYLTIGFVTLLGLWALAITSTDGWQKSLGPRWKKLHRLIFPLTVLALFHYALQSKADVTDAVFAGGVFVWLFAWRQIKRRWQPKLWLIPALALLASLSTALIEALWYGLASKKVSGWAVLSANIDPDIGLRPAQAVLLAGLALFLAIAALRTTRKLRRALKYKPLSAQT